MRSLLFFTHMSEPPPPLFLAVMSASRLTYSSLSHAQLLAARWMDLQPINK